MRKQSTTSQSGFLGPRVLITVLFCMGVACSIVTATLSTTVGKLAFLRGEAPANASQRTLSFAERVSYQRAIEEVYWRHRIWPKERADAKPAVDPAMTQTQLEKTVTEYERNSQVLEDHWHQPITAGQLQAEMERMAQNTKQPEVLRELFEALGNDPYLIAECLARPLLSERSATDFYAHDQRFHGQRGWRAQTESRRARTENPVSEVMVATSANYTLPTISGLDAVTGCTDNTWIATTTSNAPSPRSGHTAVWTGTEMIVWGGSDSTNLWDTGGRYNPATDSWRATSIINTPSSRVLHTAVWTGTEMIIWGGDDYSGLLNTGGRYNPSTNSWVATSTTNAPSARFGHTAVWTGSEMIVWGSYDYATTGGRYSPSTNTWAAISTTNAPSGRRFFTAVWTGTEMIIWGGSVGDTPTFFNTGRRYNPNTDSWANTSVKNAPTAREVQAAIWTGSEMIIWGGGNGTNLNTGGRYNPETNSWTVTSTTNAPSGRQFPTAVWTGSEMIVWGGFDGNNTNTGGRYNPNTNTWRSTSTIGAPVGEGTAVWSGSEMIVWGGGNGSRVFNTGGRYCAQPPVVPTRLGNISTRAFVQTGSNVMIGGFIVQGPQAKRVIIRAIGPELAQYGVPNPLFNPTLELHDGTGALIAFNNNWVTTIIGGIITQNQVRDIMNSGHAPGDGRESAIIADLPPGNYTAIVRGVDFMTGVALVEVYDLNPDTTSILANISTRSFVQTGANVMIGGFVVQGPQPKRVIIRGIGPELAAPPYNIPNFLANPTLELHDHAGALIASNDNWQHTIIGGIITSDQAHDVTNSGYAPTDPRESAIIAELPAGNYTAVARGVNNTTGVALVEVYDLD